MKEWGKGGLWKREDQQETGSKKGEMKTRSTK